MKVLRVVSILVTVVALFGVLVNLRGERNFTAREWRPYVRRADLFGEPRTATVDVDRMHPIGAWSPNASLAIMALHLAVTVGLASRSALRLRAMRATLHAPAQGPAHAYRAAPAPTPDASFAMAAKSARVEALAFGVAAALACATSLRDVIVLSAAGVVAHASPTQIGWYHDVHRRSGDSMSSVEAHGVRARAVVEGRAVELEARCGFGLSLLLDEGSIAPEAVPFVVWAKLPSVHQLGERPRLTGFAGWGHLLFLAGLAAYWTSMRDQARRDAA